MAPSHLVISEIKHESIFFYNSVILNCHTSFSHNVFFYELGCEFSGGKKSTFLFSCEGLSTVYHIPHYAFILLQQSLHQVSLQSQAPSSSGGGTQNPTCIRTAHTYFCRFYRNAHGLFSSSGTSGNISQNITLIFDKDWNNSRSKLTISLSIRI